MAEKGSLLSTLQARFENNMAAVAFAEANEHGLARALLDADASRQEAVLLAVQNNRFSERVMEYALNLCRRMGCGLFVINVVLPTQPPQQGPQAMAVSFAETPDVPVQLLTVRGTLSETVGAFVRQQRRTLSVVMDDACRHGDLSANKKAKSQSWWKDIGCPVIFVPAA